MSIPPSMTNEEKALSIGISQKSSQISADSYASTPLQSVKDCETGHNEEETKSDNNNPMNPNPTLARSPDDDKKQIKNEQTAIDAWLSCKLRLDKFCNKAQTFTITGWINVFWKMDKLIDAAFHPESTPHSNYQPKIERLKSLKNLAIEEQKTRDEEIHLGKAKIYSNNLKQYIIKIVDLRESAISYYLPIDANKIFHETSLQDINHIEPPSLYYNQESNLGHIQYHITATLFERLELYDFPFDRQFLNIKLKWNALYFRLLNWTNKTQSDIGHKILSHKQMDKEDTDKKEDDKKEADSQELNKNSLLNLYENGLIVDVSEALRSEIDILDPWIDFDVDDSSDTHHDKYALIRLRIKRNPTNFCFTVLIPFFIIVSCSFTIFAIDSDSIADRLGVSVTILLTFTAFQNMVDEELPKTSQREYIDTYILLAYGIQGLIIIGACLLPTVFQSAVDDETYFIIELSWICFIVAIWIGSSFFYVLKAKNVLKDQNKDTEFWEQRAIHENEEWEQKGTEKTECTHFSAKQKKKKHDNDEEAHNENDDIMRKGNKSNDLKQSLISNDQRNYGATISTSINQK